MTIHPSSPWWPLAVAGELACGRIASPENPCMPTFWHWLRWHHGFRLHGPGFIPLTAEQAHNFSKAGT